MDMDKFSLGMGDRFTRQGKAQLAAVLKAAQAGAAVAPVWNKSHREHTITHTTPASTRAEADAAVRSADYRGHYFVDADHIGLSNVDLFVDSCDFFTLDVAHFIGKSAEEPALRAFVERNRKYVGSLAIPGIGQRFEVTIESLETIARKFLLAVQEAAKIYRRIESAKGAGMFVTEVSMDESDAPQTPAELFFILSAIAAEGIPAQTIAPKFTGRFNKGVDYVGNVAQFAREFDEDLCVIAFAIKEFALPANLKLSVHSGSDKYSIYPAIRSAVRKHNAGLHLKTAGTTWLEEVTGLALGGGEGLAVAQEVYRKACERFDELCAPYATVIDIDRAALPSPAAVERWSGQEFASALRHDFSCKAYNPNLRQLIHVGYKVAAEMGERYFAALDRYEPIIAKGVTENLYRHIQTIFL